MLLLNGELIGDKVLIGRKADQNIVEIVEVALLAVILIQKQNVEEAVVALVINGEARPQKGVALHREDYLGLEKEDFIIDVDLLDYPTGT